MERVQITKKAYKVWHDGMLSDNPNDGYTLEEVPVVYAETANEAKGKLSLWEYDLPNGQAPTYLDVKVRRSKENDKVFFEGREISKVQMQNIIRHRERVNARIEKINSYPDETMFYVQNGYIGNAMSFWALKSSGYHTDISKCQKYTKEEILIRFTSIRDEEIIWPAEQIEQALIQIAHSEKVDRQFAIK